MDLSFVLLIELLYAIASLILISSGLAVVFGMMKVINLAHGEFIMMGGFVTIVAENAGVNIFVAMLLVAPITVGLIGLVVERLIIRHLYGRLIDTMLATWGLSLFFVGLVTMIFGNTTTSITTPITGFSVGDYQVNGYNFFVILVAISLVTSMYIFLKTTRFGLIARGTMQDPDIATALGYSPARVYMATFFCGSALSGLAGAVLAPLVGLVPSSGATYIAKAFITVIGGGPSLIFGLVSSSAGFGLVNQFFTFYISPVYGEVALLISAVVLLRVMPQGITGKYFRGKM
tara:strand:+ start:4054 stop:4920 length:867 start_codon:yes stop_codon:yes gene_type:complete